MQIRQAADATVVTQLNFDLEVSNIFLTTLTEEEHGFRMGSHNAGHIKWRSVKQACLHEECDQSDSLRMLPSAE